MSEIENERPEISQAFSSRGGRKLTTAEHRRLLAFLSERLWCADSERFTRFVELSAGKELGSSMPRRERIAQLCERFARFAELSAAREELGSERIAQLGEDLAEATRLGESSRARAAVAAALARFGDRQNAAE